MAELKPNFFPNPIKIAWCDGSSFICLGGVLAMAALSCLLAYKGSDFRAALAFGSIPLVILIIRVVNLSVLHRKAVRVQGRILAIKKSTDSADKTGWQFSSSTIRYEYSYLQKSFSGIRSVTDDVIASVEIGQYVTVAVDPDAPSKSDILDIYS